MTLPLKVRPDGWSQKDLDWVMAKWLLIREGQQKADKANRDWERINASIMSTVHFTNIRRAKSGREPMSDLMIAETLSASLPLQDALSTGDWHSRNAERHIADVNLFLRLKELGIL